MESGKDCTKCKKFNPIENFYVRNQKPISECKACVKKRVSDWVKTPRGSLLRNRQVKRGIKAHGWRRLKKWRKNHGDKYKAHYTVYNALKSGLLKKEPCGRCRTTKNVHAHHEDYSRPLNIVWLCQAHHRERHKELDVMI